MAMEDRRDINLLCSETDGIPRAFEDKVMLEDERVISNLLQMEERFLPSGGYFTSQPEVKPYMRREVAQWMLEVCEIEHREHHLNLSWVLVFGSYVSLITNQQCTYY